MKDFPEAIRFNEKPTTKYYNSKNNIKVTMLQSPPKDFRDTCCEMIMSTWKDDANQETLYNEEIINDLFSFKVLPNSMEAFNFTFKIEGLTHIESTHMLRHRTFKGIHYQCSGDRFLTHDSVFIPSSIENSEFNDRYRKITEDTKQLYQDMVDSKKISLMDARYILNRNHRYFAYFTMNIKEVLAFINQRKCTMIQPELDNVIAKQIYELVIKEIPELSKVLTLKCGPKCHFIISKPERNTRLYKPDKTHAKYMTDDHGSIYNNTRLEMGCEYDEQDRD